MIRNLVAEQKTKGHTVLLVSHLLTEVELLCDRAAVLVNGKIKRTGTIAELTRDPATANLNPWKRRCTNSMSNLLVSPPEQNGKHHAAAETKQPALLFALSWLIRDTFRQAAGQPHLLDHAGRQHSMHRLLA